MVLNCPPYGCRSEIGPTTPQSKGQAMIHELWSVDDIASHPPPANASGSHPGMASVCDPNDCFSCRSCWFVRKATAPDTDCGKAVSQDFPEPREDADAIDDRGVCALPKRGGSDSASIRCSFTMQQERTLITRAVKPNVHRSRCLRAQPAHGSTTP